MTASNGILALVGDAAIRDDIDRVAAAAGLPVVHASDPSSRKVWTAAAAVLLDVAAARRCAHRALPRRGRVVLLVRSEPRATDFQAAIAVGAQHVITLPAHDGALMAELSDAAEASRDTGRRGAVVGVIAGRGGAGASVFATALAQTSTEIPKRCSSTPIRGVAASTWSWAARARPVCAGPISRCKAVGSATQRCATRCRNDAASACCRAVAPAVTSTPHRWAR